MNRPLSQRLREDTKDAHTAAERVPFVTRLFRGGLTRDEWVGFLANLRALYEALEEGLERNASHPAVAPVFFPELARAAALRADLEHFLGEKGAQGARPSPAGARYAAYVRALAERDPALLVPHAYTRYLGDLSGGQVMKKSVQKSFGLAVDDPSDTRGVEFFTFAKVADAKAAKDRYRAGLDAIALDEAQLDRLVEEAKVAFERNAEMMADLGPREGAAAGI